MTKARDTANLVSSSSIHVNVGTDNIGIGTTNPTEKLDVIGNIKLTGEIRGPANFIIDPAAVGDNTGAVRIKGDLYVDGTQTYINSSTIELADFNVGIATTVGTNALLDGAGIGIGSTGIRKTITWNNTASALTSSEDWNLVSGKQYEINGTSVLTSTTLGSGVVNSSLTSVGTLGQLNVSGISTFTSPNTSPIVIRSGASGSYTNLDIGRTGTEGIFAVASSAGIFANNAVAGDIIIRNNNATGKILFNRGATNASLAIDGSNVLVGSVSSTGTASQPLQVTGGAYVSGNLGVGNTNPQAELHVEQSIDGEIFRLQRSGGSNIPILAFDLSDASNVATIRGTGATGAEIAFNAGSQERVRIKTTGNVGIGTTNPSYRIDVNNTAGGNAGIRLLSADQSTTRIRLQNTGSGGRAYEIVGGLVGVNNSHLSIYDATATATRLTITETGAVGIGTVDPAATGSTLGVAGTITELYQGQYWNVVTQADVGIGASQVPLNQYLGQLAFVDEYSPTTLLTPRLQSVGERTTLISGNTVNLTYNTGGGNIAICTNPTGDITLNVTGIPTDSSFDNTSLTFSVFVNNTGTARSCTAVNLNGVPETIRWAGGSLAAAVVGVTTSNGYDIYSFTGINTVGSAATAANYHVLGVVNGGYR